jgi:NADH dehydrogenase [ubiquinone] 1 alpha subcomplex assembly factor 7
MIAGTGPIPVARYMAEANAYYYTRHAPIGSDGDFITAPEISQMFGELIGLWLADLWDRSGRPRGTCYVELGPGRGTLAEDALRAMAKAGLQPAVELVEASPALREAQASRLAGARWHESLDNVPADGPLLIVANEFFDALPIRQLVATTEGWRERMVAADGDRFVPVAGPPIGTGQIPAHLSAAPPGTIMEVAPAASAIAGAIAARLSTQGGAALIIDYGYDRSRHGDTLQAVTAHDHADRWSQPGERDLSAHVDFEALAAAAAREGVRVTGPVGQGKWLQALGIDIRASALARSAPERRGDIETARARLTDTDQMGTLFRVLALTGPDWATPAGFA